MVSLYNKSTVCFSVVEIIETAKNIKQLVIENKKIYQLKKTIEILV